MTAEPPSRFMCPITCDVMVDPVMCPQGHNFERYAIEACIQLQGKCPMDRSTLSRAQIFPNRALKEEIEEWTEYGKRQWQRPAAAMPAPTSGQNTADIVKKRIESLLRDYQDDQGRVKEIAETIEATQRSAAEALVQAKRAQAEERQKKKQADRAVQDRVDEAQMSQAIKESLEQKEREQQQQEQREAIERKREALRARKERETIDKA